VLQYINRKIGRLPKRKRREKRKRKKKEEENPAKVYE
jgi:hypothetical protein